MSDLTKVKGLSTRDPSNVQWNFVKCVCVNSHEYTVSHILRSGSIERQKQLAQSAASSHDMSLPCFDQGDDPYEVVKSYYSTSAKSEIAAIILWPFVSELLEKDEYKKSKGLVDFYYFLGGFLRLF